MPRTFYISTFVLLVAFGFGGLSSVFGQVDTVYLDGQYQQMDSKLGARYYRLSMPLEDQVTSVTMYYITGVKKMEGHYVGSDPRVEEGEFIYYYRNGQVESRGRYCKGKKCGIWKRYAWDGSERSDRLYPDPGSFQRKIVDEPAQFPGGYEGLLAYIETTTTYPKEAIGSGIEGTVKISFRIDEGGLVRDVELVDQSAPLIGDAALRVIYDMPLWMPAKRNGEEMSSTFILPFEFRIKEGKGSITVGS